MTERDELADALGNLLGFLRLSGEHAATVDVALSRVEELRREASRLEAVDQAIRWARTALAKYRQSAA